jgi:hypothetical protein
VRGVGMREDHWLGPVLVVVVVVMAAVAAFVSP